MDPITQVLLNTGGMGALAAVLFWLYRQALSSHRVDLQKSWDVVTQELKDQRALFTSQIAAERELCQEYYRAQQAINESILQTLTNLEASRGK